MARKTTTVITCDNPSCKEFREVGELKETPEHWYLVAQANERNAVSMTVGTFTLCSLRCLEKWSKERRFALEGSGKQKAPGHSRSELEQQGQDNKAMILMAIEDQEGITSPEIQAMLNLSQPTVDRWLRELREEESITSWASGKSKAAPRRYRIA